MGVGVSHERGTPVDRVSGAVCGRGGAVHGGGGGGGTRKVDVRLPGKRNSNSHGARPVY